MSTFLHKKISSVITRKEKHVKLNLKKIRESFKNNRLLNFFILGNNKTLNILWKEIEGIKKVLHLCML